MTRAALHRLLSAVVGVVVGVMFVGVVGVTACAPSSPPPSSPSSSSTPTSGPEVVTLQGSAWCGSWSATVTAAQPAQAARVRALRPLVDGVFAELARQIDTKNPDSELSAFHTPPERQPRRETAPPPRGTVSQGTALLVKRALAVAAATGGAFDPTRPAVPMTATSSTKRPTFARVQVKDGRLLQDGYDVVVDLDGVAAAAAAMAVARVLAENGFSATRVVVGDVVVEHERAQAKAVRGDALVDPRTGAPAAAGPSSCVVDADDAVVAAALARACLVLPAADIAIVAATYGETYGAKVSPSSSSRGP